MYFLHLQDSILAVQDKVIASARSLQLQVQDLQKFPVRYTCMYMYVYIAMNLKKIKNSHKLQQQ